MKKLRKTLAGTACAVMAASCILASPASAKYMKSMKVSPATNAFGGPVIEVRSDGESWTQIKEGPHIVEVKVDIQAGSGWRIWSAYIGVPSADFGGTSLSTDAVRRLGGGKDTKTIERTEPHTFHTDDLLFDRTSIINLCNSTGHPATEEHTEFTTIGVGIKAYFQTRKQAKGLQEAGNDAGRSETAYTRAPVTIKCLAGPSRIEAPPEPYSLDLNLTSLENKCPQKTEVRAFIKYKVPATARFRFVHNGKKSAWHDIKARKIGGKPGQAHGPGSGIRYLVERVKYYHLDPGEHRFRIEMASGKKSDVKTIKTKCPPFKVTSAWLKYDVEDTPVCKKWVKEKATFKSTRPGSAPFRIKTQGGLVVHSGTAKFERKGLEYVAKIKRKLKMGAFDQDMMAEITNDPAANSGWTRLRVECLELSGDFSFIDNNGPRCPRKGMALINFVPSLKADIHYSLDCTNGHFSGIAKAVSDNKGGYVAPALVKLDIKKTKQVNCALKSVAPGKTKVHALKGHLFQCITPAGHSGANDFKPETRPKPRAPRVPGKAVIDRPRQPSAPGKVTKPVPVGCYGGAVRNNACFCPRTHAKKKIGVNAYRCVKKTLSEPVRPGKGKPGLSVRPGGGKGKTAVPPKRKTSAPPKRKRSSSAKKTKAKKTVRRR